MDASLFLLIPAILTNVWYWQLIIPGLTSLRLGIVSILAAALAFGMSGRSIHHVLAHPAALPVRLTILVGVLAVVGGPFAIVRGSAVDFIVYTFIPAVILTFLIAARVQSRYALRVVLDTLIGGGLLYAFVFLRAPVDSWGKPYGLPYYDANDGAIVALCCLGLTLGRLALTSSWGGRFLQAGIALVYLAVIVQSSSRGAFLSLVITVGIVLVTARSVPVRWRAVAVSGGVLVVLALGSSRYWDLMSTILEPEKDYNWAGNSDTGRIELWRRGFGYMVEHPVLGVGARNYVNKEGRSTMSRQAEMEGRGSSWTVAHNAFVEIGVELGIPGLVCFIAILWGSIRRLRRASLEISMAPEFRRLFECQLATLGGFSIASIFISSQYWTFLYVMIATVTSSLLIGYRERHETQRVPTGRRRGPPRRVSQPVPGAAR